MQHVGQSLDVHQAMLNRYVEQSVHLDAVQLNECCSSVPLSSFLSSSAGQWSRNSAPHSTGASRMADR